MASATAGLKYDIRSSSSNPALVGFRGRHAGRAMVKARFPKIDVPEGADATSIAEKAAAAWEVHMFNPDDAILDYYGNLKAAHLDAIDAPYDRNRDGNIDPELMKSYLEFKKAYRARRNAEIRVRLTEIYDADGDGCISQAEIAWLWHPDIRGKVFNLGEWKILAMDTDGNDVVDEVEAEVASDLYNWMSGRLRLSATRVIPKPINIAKLTRGYFAYDDGPIMHPIKE